jgi:hypothetical protein
MEPVDRVVEVEASVPGVRKRRRRSASDKKASTPSWEHDLRTRSRRSEKKIMVSMVGGAALLVLVAVLFASLSKSPSGPTPPRADPERSTAFEPQEGGESPTDVLPDIPTFLHAAQPLAKTFLEATTVPELLATVRRPEISSQRMAQRYPDGKVEAPGLQSFAEDGAVVIEATTATVKVRIGNFEQRDLYFVRTREGWRVDWESWVGWSDLSWDTFAEKAPREPGRFRVRVKPIIYYNFGFSDERKWRSYLIESPDGSHRFFGYVERGSRVDGLINLADSPAGGDFILELCFPADNIGRNQVLIHDRIAVGWVEPEKVDSP